MKKVANNFLQENNINDNSNQKNIITGKDLYIQLTSQNKSFINGSSISPPNISSISTIGIKTGKTKKVSFITIQKKAYLKSKNKGMKKNI